MPLNLRVTLFVILTTLLLGAFQNANATHISEPILNDSKTTFRLGENIILNGWVNYANKPTADVLLAFKVTRPDGSIATEASYTSDNNGQFEFEFVTNTEPGKYLMTITSHCQAIHRSICTYKNQTLTIDIVE